jgi:hypothetical protein
LSIEIGLGRERTDGGLGSARQSGLAHLVIYADEYGTDSLFMATGKHEARMVHYDRLYQSYVWLVDLRVIKRLRGDEDVEDYGGCMKLHTSRIYDT